MNKFSRLSKISFLVDILQHARETLLQVENIVSVNEQNEVLETITSAIDEVYNLLDKEEGAKE